MPVFLTNDEAFSLLEKYGSPLYVYSEEILRARCRELTDAFGGRIKPSFSIKANTNVEICKIIRSEGAGADATSQGEIYMAERAGFLPEEMFYIGNNVSAEELRHCVSRGILVSVDSLSQLETYGKTAPGSRVAARFNPGIGAGHHDKVVTAGHKTKFGIDPIYCEDVKKTIKKYDLKLTGINQHIGSLFLEPEPYVAAAKNLLDMIADAFPGLEFIDFGGGFGVPYRESERRLDFNLLREELFAVIDNFLVGYDAKGVRFKCEPGRYFVAECGLLLGTVHSVKKNYGSLFVGTDIGFNVLMRPVLYGSYHEVSLLKKDGSTPDTQHCDAASVVGNICESGDVLAEARKIGNAEVGDAVVVENAGAYGYSMATSYNCRPRPAEVLKTLDGDFRLIRRAETFEQMARNFC